MDVICALLDMNLFYVHPCFVCMYVCVPCACGISRFWKKVLGPLEQDLLTALSSMGVLGTKPGSSARATRAPHC